MFLKQNWFGKREKGNQFLTFENNNSFTSYVTSTLLKKEHYLFTYEKKIVRFKIFSV